MPPSRSTPPPNAALSTKRPRTHAEINEFRRRALLEGAIRSFAEHGVAGTTNRTICQAAGASSGLIQHYFESKDKLVAAAFAYLLNRTADAVREAVQQAGPSALDRLHAMPLAVLSTAIATEETKNAFLSFWHEIRFNALVRAENKEFYRDYAQRTEALFAAAASELERDIDTRRSARGLICLLDGLWLNLSMERPVLSAHDADSICRRYIDGELGAR
ncbi:MAG: TetR family transcriptional regulator C-terminal domain-containing protein [Marivibrio sp.]|uniref:TetR family transcriptional regulator C-terminal domain-containing protein n=1 Tax=Marivibrio sp. TaxID=2039719 RepID=UPI0032EBD237